MMTMLSRLSAEQRLVVANLVLFLVVGIGALLLMTESPELPAAPPIKMIDLTLQGMSSSVVVESTDVQKFQNFGQKNIFPVLVPLPTPSPTPPPTPVPDPKLAEAIKDWKLGGFGPNMVFMTDLKSNTDWHMDLDDPATSSKSIRFQNQDMVIKLEPPIDLVNLKVTFSYTGREGKQTVDKALFSD